MKKIKLNENAGTVSHIEGYVLDAKEQYVIAMDKELDSQLKIAESFQIMGYPPALKNYHAWLHENGFNVERPNPTNAFVAPFFGVKPLWETPYSQGLVVKCENSEDYYIVMECSGKNKGFRHTQVVLTLGGCL